MSPTNSPGPIVKLTPARTGRPASHTLTPSTVSTCPPSGGTVLLLANLHRHQSFSVQTLPAAPRVLACRATDNQLRPEPHDGLLACCARRWSIGPSRLRTASTATHRKHGGSKMRAALMFTEM